MYALLLASMALPAQTSEPTATVAPVDAPITTEAPTPPVVVVETAPTAPPQDLILEAARALGANGEFDAQRALLDWILAQEDLEPQVLASAESLYDAIPGSRDKVRPLVKLAIWQGIAGAVVLGAVPGTDEFYGDNEVAYLLGALVGGAAGAGGAIALSRRDDFSNASANAIMGAQALGGFNGGVLMSYADGNHSDYYYGPREYWGGPAGIMLGTALGTVGGHLWAIHDPDPATAAALQTGGIWGLGLGLAGMTYTYAWDRTDGDDQPLPLLIATDLGALGGVALAHFTNVNPRQIRIANYGALAGAGAAYSFAYMTHEIIWYAQHDVVAIITLSGLGGAALAVVLDEKLGQPRVSTDSHVQLGLPGPIPIRTEEGVRMGVSFLNLTF